ncbi:MAG: type VI secretion system ImpA family N-terminal domain-containing protein [Rubrivivax sp.]
MDLQPLLAPIPGDLPEGRSCQDERAFREMKLLGEYLVEQAKARELERQLREPFRGDSAAAEKQMVESMLERVQSALKERIVPAASEVLGGADATVRSVVQGIQSRALPLLQSHGKDLGVVVKLALAETASRGVAGLADAAQLFEALFDQHGQRVHPQPDEEGDSFERNKLLTEWLSGQDLQALLRQAVLAAASHTRLTLRDLEGREGLTIPKDQKDPVAGLNNDLEVLEAFAGAVVVDKGIRRDEVSAQDQWAWIEAQLAPIVQAVARLQSLARKFRAPMGPGAHVFRLLDRAMKVLQAARLVLPLSHVSTTGVGGLAASIALVEPLLGAEGDTLDRNRPLYELLAGERMLLLLRGSPVFAKGAATITLGDLASTVQPLPESSPGAGLTTEHHLLAELAAVLAAEQQVEPADVDLNDKLARLDALVVPVAASLDALRALARTYRVAAEAAPVLALVERAHVSLLRARLVLAPVRVAPPALAPLVAAGSAEVGASAAPSAAAVMPTPVGMLRTREDARLAILAIAAFLEQTEPSHPSSLFLHRAAKLLQAKSFFDIVQELLPGSPVDTISTLTGAKPPET